MLKIQNLTVLTFGGDSPGMNACIRSVTCPAICRGIGVYGLLMVLTDLLEMNL